MVKNLERKDFFRYKIKISYDGLDYFGWQNQPQKNTVQGEIEKALFKISGNKLITIEGSGRTDTGVHARGQIAHFDLPKSVNANELKIALNSLLKKDIRIHSLVKTSQNFHARYDVKSKEYRYFIYNGGVMPPNLRNYSHHEHRILNLKKMEEAVTFLIGNHDFSVFSVNPGYQIENSVRTINNINIKKINSMIVISVIGNGFLYKMVRGLVGFLIDIGLEKFEPSFVKNIFEQKKRDKNVKTAPSNGLFLWKVNY